ncbi:MAG: MCE family protein [Deltaproteobacteria bacterium]|nr:MCE family protein [Deltaproteobacteria bacterium]
MNKKLSPTAVGAFVLGAMTLVVIGIVVFGSGRYFRKSYEFVLFFDSSVNGLKIGAPVKVKGVEIGTVNNILLDLKEEPVPGVPMVAMREVTAPEKPSIPVIIEIDPEKLTSRGGSGEALTDPAEFDELIQRGLRGRLAVESLVTGLLYIDLDFFPDSPINLSAPPGSKFREIPTLPTTLQEVENQVREVIENLRKVKLAELVNESRETVRAAKRLLESEEVMLAINSMTAAFLSIDQLARNANAHVDPVGKGLRETMKKAQDALQDARQLVRNVDKQVDPLAKSLENTFIAVRAAMAQGKKTLATADALIADDSPFYHNLTIAVTELSRAARSVRALADYLERNPSAIITGKR